MTVAAGRVIAQPVHLCFGLFERFGVRNVDLELVMEAGSIATFWSHCLFMFPDMARHAMDARVELQPGARLTYNEVHYHGLSGGIEVVPRARVKVGEGAHYRADFTLTQGRVGKLAIDYEVSMGRAATAELTSKVFGHLADEIDIRERVLLDGEDSRGHVDCLEIVRGHAVASAIPEVKVTHAGAKVTHEAAIGSVDERQIEALMARGLDPDAAVDRIILGMLG